MSNNQTQKDLSLNRDVLVQGIAPSSIFGLKQVQNMDIFNIDGVARAGFEFFNTTAPSVSTTFTADSGTDTLTVGTTFRWTAVGQTINAYSRAVTVSSTGSLPTGLTAGVIYYIIDVTSTTIKLASTVANSLVGTPIDITTDGSGIMSIISVNPGLFVNFDARYDTGAEEVFAQDSNGRVWFYNTSAGWVLVDGNTLTTASGNGMKIWKDYLFAFRNSAVDLYGPLTGSAVWSNSWTGINSLSGNSQSNDHLCFESQNDRLYVANRINSFTTPAVAELRENPTTTFDPTNSATYTWNSNALDLPQYEFITCFEEFNNTLQIGTTSNKIYPWDKVSDSFGTPITTSEPYVRSMRVLNNILYYGCGFRGNIYNTYGTTSQIILDLSDDLSNYPQTSAIVYDMAIYQGVLLAAISGAIGGVYVIDVNNGNRYSILNTNSNSSSYPFKLFTMFNATSNSYIPYRYFCSWATLGLGTVGCDSNIFRGNGPYRVVGDKAFIISELIRIGGDSNTPRTLETIEIFLKKAITNGQSVKVQLRYDDNSTFDTAKEFTYANMVDGKYLTGWDKADLEKSRFVQMKVIISIPTPANGTFSQFNTPEIVEVRLV